MTNKQRLLKQQITELKRMADNPRNNDMTRIKCRQSIAVKELILDRLIEKGEKDGTF